MRTRLTSKRKAKKSDGAGKKKELEAQLKVAVQAELEWYTGNKMAVATYDPSYSSTLATLMKEDGLLFKILGATESFSELNRLLTNPFTILADEYKLSIPEILALEEELARAYPEENPFDTQICTWDKQEIPESVNFPASNPEFVNFTWVNLINKCLKKVAKNHDVHNVIAKCVDRERIADLQRIQSIFSQTVNGYWEIQRDLEELDNKLDFYDDACSQNLFEVLVKVRHRRLRRLYRMVHERMDQTRI